MRTICILFCLVRSGTETYLKALLTTFAEFFLFGMAIESFFAGADRTYQKRHETNKGGIFRIMLETIIVILLVLWLVGLVAGQTFGGILHVLLLVAVVVFVIRLLTGRAAV
jgi:hypothetical protein